MITFLNLTHLLNRITWASFWKDFKRNLACKHCINLIADSKVIVIPELPGIPCWMTHRNVFYVTVLIVDKICSGGNINSISTNLAGHKFLIIQHGISRDENRLCNLIRKYINNAHTVMVNKSQCFPWNIRLNV